MPAAMRDMIADTYLSLIERKNVDKVTVKDLVENCAISRQTFYYHFKDILEVIDWATDRQVNRVLARSLEQPTLEKAIGVYVSSITGNRDGIRRGLASAKGPYIERALYESLRTYLLTLFRKKGPQGAVDPDDMEVALQFCTGGIISVLLIYCKSNDIDEERLSQQLARHLVSINQALRS